MKKEIFGEEATYIKRGEHWYYLHTYLQFILSEHLLQAVKAFGIFLKK
jgi:hypothetical protein